MITMYDYQKNAFIKIMEAFLQQVAVLIVMATGLGKTIVSTFFSESEFKHNKKGLFLCHENDILDQAFKDFRRILGKQAVLRKFYGQDKDWDADNADVLFASFQSFKKWYEVFDKNHFDYIIVDESHHGQAPTYKEVIQYFTPKKLLGMTATPDREDQKDIREIFGEEVVNYTLVEALSKGWLTNVEYRIKNDGINTSRLRKILRDVLEKKQRISVKQLNETIFVKKRDEEIAREIHEIGQQKKTIIFCENIQHVENFATFLPNAAVFHSKVTDGKNKKILQDFRDGKLNYILAVNKFNEGIDIPDAEVIVFLRSTDSLTIFLQQLGRGLRKIINKEKVIVLDFVANCERLMYLAEIGKKVKEESRTGFELTKDNLHVTGESFDFIFSDVQVDILSILNRIRTNFYPTWEEASKSAIALGLTTVRQYQEKRYVDPYLPFHPAKYYKDFPGYGVFFGTGIERIKRDVTKYYPTWKEASEAAINLNIKTHKEYQKNYSIDDRLPAGPHNFYKDFPGYGIFLGTGRRGRVKNQSEKYYPTWEEASESVIKLGINNITEYELKRKFDVRLPSRPRKFYNNFPGNKIFFANKSAKNAIEDYYQTWKEASKIVCEWGIKSMREYKKIFYKDIRLPSTPHKFYKNFPGYAIFLKTKRTKKRKRDSTKYYLTWEEASEAAINLNIKTQREYRKNYYLDPRLPSNPRNYYVDFPGYRKYLKIEKK